MGKRQLRVVSFVLVLATVWAGRAMAADPNLVGWWPLNEGSGDTVADLSGSGMNGTIINPAGGLGLDGSVWIEDAERGMVLSFNGVNGTGACVTTGVTIPAMDLTTDFTWMFWCRQDASQGFTAATGGNDVILGNRYGGTAAPLQFVKFTPTNFEFYNGDNTNFLTYPEVMPPSVWVHNVTVKKGATLTYYRDGSEVRSITLTKTMDANPLYMGADAFSGVQEAWSGCLSDVRIYNKAVTQLEILAADRRRRTDRYGSRLCREGPRASTARSMPSGTTHRRSLSFLWRIRPMPPAPGRCCMMRRISTFSWTSPTTVCKMIRPVPGRTTAWRSTSTAAIPS